ncbi:hypothetical protein FRC12_002838 [Ceratobasidium sp. 428]|nr:hypothetical protein FRC12_002838 [Ceratobasidium sp. 428]
MGSEGSWDARCQAEIAELTRKSNNSSTSKETRKSKIHPKMRPVSPESDNSDDATTPPMAVPTETTKKAESTSCTCNMPTDR